MNHLDRVRRFLREWQKMHPAGDDLIQCQHGIRHELAARGHGLDQCLTVADLDALCRDAERLTELEDL